MCGAGCRAYCFPNRFQVWARLVVRQTGATAGRFDVQPELLATAAWFWEGGCMVFPKTEGGYDRATPL